jgi:hypothetical protein
MSLERTLDTWIKEPGATLDFGGSLHRIIIALCTVDARKAMKGAQGHQTVCGMRLMNHDNLWWTVQGFRSLVNYEGQDSNKLLRAHLAPILEESREMVKFPAVGLVPQYHYQDMQDRKSYHYVRFLWSSDGKGRRELLGRSSAASKHPMGWNHLKKEEVSDLHVLAPISLTERILGDLAPPNNYNHAQRLKHARVHGFGQYAESVINQDPQDLLPDELHQMFLLVGRLLSFTHKATIEDDATPDGVLELHVRQCLGVPNKLLFQEQDGRIVVAVKGNDCKILINESENIVHCSRCSIFSSKAQRHAVREVWRWGAKLVMDNRNMDPAATMSHHEYFRTANTFLRMAVAVFGKAFVTPTMRELRDQNPFFKRKLNRLGLETQLEVFYDGID